jgi:hypothetical protein
MEAALHGTATPEVAARAPALLSRRASSPLCRSPSYARKGCTMTRSARGTGRRRAERRNRGRKRLSAAQGLAAYDAAAQNLMEAFWKHQEEKRGKSRSSLPRPTSKFSLQIGCLGGLAGQTKTAGSRSYGLHTREQALCAIRRSVSDR